MGKTVCPHSRGCAYDTDQTALLMIGGSVLLLAAAMTLAATTLPTARIP